MKYTKRTILLAHKNGVLPRLRKQLIVSEIRKRYDADDEIAIIRQKEEKPEEYTEYFAFAENCKKNVDEYINLVIK